MTCRDCLHYEACKGTYFTFKQMIDKDSFDKEHYADVYNCPDFTDRSEWVHLPCKVGDLVYVIRRKEKRKKGGYWNSICFTKKVMQTAIKDGTAYIDCKRATKTDFSLVGKTVFLTREEAEKALERSKGNETNL